MRAWAVVENGKDLQEIELPTPEPTGTQVLLEVTHCGVCHSDLHIWDGYYDLGSGQSMNLKDRGVVLPLAMGHEIVGRVVKLGPEASGVAVGPEATGVAVGPEASGVAVGDVRIVYPWLGCGHCDRCLAEEDNMCLVSRSLGVYQNGGYGTHVVAPHPRHLIDPGTVDPALAATYACSGVTVYSAIQKVLPMPPDKPVVLIGAGGLGLAAIAVLKALGHRAIVSVDVSADKRTAAQDAGATAVVDGNGEDVAKRITAACGGPAEAIIDLVNGSGTAAFAFAALRKGGKLIQVGLFGGELRLPLPLMAIRSLSVMGSYVGNPKELRALVALAQDGTLPATPITTMPQPQANAALMRLRDGKVTGRVVLTAA